MMKHTLVASLAAMAIATSAFAQDNQPDMQNTEPSANAPAAPGADPALPEGEAVAPNVTSPDAQPQTEAAAPEAMPTESVDYIAQQQSGEWLASRFIGTSVENSGGEDLGDINDIIVGEGGDVVGAVIGVGGFLGMGEKNVAVPFEKISTAMKGENESVIVLNVTKEELEAAPDYADLEGQPLSLSTRVGQAMDDATDDESETTTQ